MKHCNRILTLFTLLLISCGMLCAQDFASRIKADKDIAAGVYHPYHHGDMTDTPAPKGYVPFYISHYGRHGSRYHTGDRFFKDGIAGLERAKKEGILNDTGKKLYDEFFTVVNEHKGMEGELSPLGAREHRGIADRMYRRFPEVFNDKNRYEVDSKASIVPRCLISMANFTTQLKDDKPSLQFTFDTGHRYYEYIAKSIEGTDLFDRCNRFEDSVRAVTCHYDKLMELIFTDKEKGMAAVKDPQKFIKSIFLTGSICGDLDFLGIDLFKYLDPEELAEQSLVRSDKFYGQFGNSLEWGEVSSAVAKNLAKDFIEKADAALKDGSRRAADLRFGHDTGILPLFGLIGLKGMDIRYPMATGHDHWTTYDNIPMGTNFQMVFYRNKKGDVLVKMLYNEQETTIPALKTGTGPYYRWSDLRSYIAGKASL